MMHDRENLVNYLPAEVTLNRDKSTARDIGIPKLDLTIFVSTKSRLSGALSMRLAQGQREKGDSDKLLRYWEGAFGKWAQSLFVWNVYSIDWQGVVKMEEHRF